MDLTMSGSVGLPRPIAWDLKMVFNWDAQLYYFAGGGGGELGLDR